nr:hypothetical protein [Gymnodinialimonas phycosphaerae]
MRSVECAGAAACTGSSMSTVTGIVTGTEEPAPSGDWTATADFASVLSRNACRGFGSSTLLLAVSTALQ